MQGERTEALPRFHGHLLYPEDGRRFLSVVRAAPGRTLRALAKAAGLHPNVARGHARALAQQGHVVQRRLGSRILVYPTPAAPRRGKRAVAADAELRVDVQRRLLALILKQPGLRQDQIIETTQHWGWPRATAQHRLGRLVQSGLLKSHIQGRERHYEAQNSLVESRLGALALQPK